MELTMRKLDFGKEEPLPEGQLCEQGTCTGMADGPCTICDSPVCDYHTDTKHLGQRVCLWCG